MTEQSVARSKCVLSCTSRASRSFHAFAFTAPAVTRAKFCVAGSGECPEGQGNYRDISCAAAMSALDGLAEKARWVLGEMERRLALLAPLVIHNRRRRSTPCTISIRSWRAEIVGAWRRAGGPHVALLPPAGCRTSSTKMDCRGVAVEHVVRLKFMVLVDRLPSPYSD
jgi:hypothetical protein